MEPIAIIGIGCRFPQANGPDGFWRLLKDGVDAISEVPANRWDIERFYDPDPSVPGKMITRWGGFLDHVEAFDPDLFAIPLREAEKMDPQQRLLLEVAWEALEDAGQAVHHLARTACGVFIGATNNHFAHLEASRPELIDAFSGTGGSTSIIANRISYCFDLRGPSMVIDTACSSSLIAVHLACQSLWTGESYPIALAGGVNVILSPVGTIFFSKAGAMAPDGRTKVFEAGSNGFARGEGAGVMVLKPLKEALADRDFIYAVIRGGAVNQDGRSNGLMAPNRWSQEAVIREALRRTDLAGGHVQYVETHATGTLLGDTIEAAALAAVLAKDRLPGARCAVGSVKTNFGHLESAAGIAGLIKVALMLKHRMIPPNVHFTKPNPYINFAKSPLRVPTRLESWPEDQQPALAGISAFGFGGTNAHLLVQEAPDRPAVHTDVERPIHLLTLSARSESLLRQLAVKFADYFSKDRLPTLPDICFTANTGRSHFSFRIAIVTDSPADARKQLNALRNDSNTSRIITPPNLAGNAQKLAFLFTGEGSELSGIARHLYREQPAFRAALDKCLAVWKETGNEGASRHPFTSADELFSQTKTEQPALFTMQYALAQMWLSWGITPEALIGHGTGEYLAACISGIFRLEDALKLVTKWDRLMTNSDCEEVPMETSGQLRQCLETVEFSSPSIPLVSSALGRMLTASDCAPDAWPHPITSPAGVAEAIQFLLHQEYRLFLRLGTNSFLDEIMSLSGRAEFLLLPTILSEPADHWPTLLSTLSQLYLRGIPVDWAGFDRGYQRYKVPLPTSVFDHGQAATHRTDREDAIPPLS
jgi:iturin family lipopeptide synthetase A